MPMLLRARRGAVSFGLLGLAGPLLQLLVAWSPSLWDQWPAVRSIVHGLVTLLWPIRLLALGTTQTSTELLFLIVCGNVLLFAIFGAAAGLLSSSRKSVALLAGGVVFATLFSARFLVGSLWLTRTWVVVLPVLISTLALLWRGAPSRPSSWR